MREIKFRAWDPVAKGMFFVKGCWFEEQGSYDETDLQEIAGNIILMQYTGLKDKNGVEIYEGDIITSIYNIPERISNPNITIEDIRHLPVILWETARVIGNIYENPELLEAK